jgi:hypothetical protein
MLPPISSMRRLEMASPRPVPPWRPCRTLLGLLELGEDAVDGMSRNAWAGVAHRETEHGGVAGARFRRDVERQTDAARLRELDGVAHQVHQDLADAHLVADHGPRHLGRSQPADRQTLVAGPRRQQLDHALGCVGDLERRRPELDLAGLDLGEVEHLIDQRQQCIGRGRDGAGISALLGRELGVEQEAGHAENAVHRRSDLVAHRGEEARLRLACFHCLVAVTGERQFAVTRLALAQLPLQILESL